MCSHETTVILYEVRHVPQQPGHVGHSLRGHPGGEGGGGVVLIVTLETPTLALQVPQYRLCISCWTLKHGIRDGRLDYRNTDPGLTV